MAGSLWGCSPFSFYSYRWEKYDGNTGERACADYSAPPMVGWTAGVYIYFNKELGII